MFPLTYRRCLILTGNARVIYTAAMCDWLFSGHALYVEIICQMLKNINAHRHTQVITHSTAVVDGSNGNQQTSTFTSSYFSHKRPE